MVNGTHEVCGSYTWEGWCPVRPSGMLSVCALPSSS